MCYKPFMEYIKTMPPGGERCVSMVEFKGKMYLATERHVYCLNNETNEFEPVHFAILETNTD